MPITDNHEDIVAGGSAAGTALPHSAKDPGRSQGPAPPAWRRQVSQPRRPDHPPTRRQDRLLADRVEREHERVTVTRNGHAAAVILSPEDLAQLEETLDVLSDPDALADIREADAAYRARDVVRGVDAVRALRP
jgi:prevent-host-death family protein